MASIAARLGHSAVMAGFLETYADVGASLQTPMDAAVVVPTLLRPSLIEALHSIFAQDFAGRIHVLVGVDSGANDTGIIGQICAKRPVNCVVQVLDPGYSSSARRGGLHPCREAGVLRAVLTYLANSRYVAYLDEENSWHPQHLRLLRAAVPPAEWACTLSRLVPFTSNGPGCTDIRLPAESDCGLESKQFDGRIDPNCLMIDKLACEHAITWWTIPHFEGAGADHSVLAYLREYHRGVAVEKTTVFRHFDPADPLHAMRQERLDAGNGRTG